MQTEFAQNDLWLRCQEACRMCAVACNECAAACLREPDVQAMARCIALDMDCASICTAAAGFMDRQSDYASGICSACEVLCTACAGECGQHQMDHCQRCAAACRRCADACKAMVEGL